MPAEDKQFAEGLWQYTSEVTTLWVKPLYFTARCPLSWQILSNACTFLCNLGKEIFLEIISRLPTVNFSKKCASLPMFWKTKVGTINYYNYNFRLTYNFFVCLTSKQEVQSLLDHCVVFLGKTLTTKVPLATCEH